MQCAEGFSMGSPGCRPQVIDVDAQQLQNAITFPPEGAFLVDSAIEVGGLGADAVASKMVPAADHSKKMIVFDCVQNRS